MSDTNTKALIDRHLGQPAGGLGIQAERAEDRVSVSAQGALTRVKINVGAFTQAVTAASLGFGRKILELPAGQYVFLAGYIRQRIQSDGAAAITATTECGIGTTIASGAVEVLSGTAAFENIIDGSTINMGAIAAGASNEVEAGARAETDAIGSSSPISIFLNNAVDGDGAGNLTIDADVELVFTAFPNQL